MRSSGRCLPAPGMMALVLILLPVISSCASLSQEEALSERNRIDAMVDPTLVRLFEARPELRVAFEESPGYAIASMKQTKVPVFGGSRGTGVVIDKRTGERTYLQVTRLDVGGGMGISTSKIVVLFQDADLLSQAMTGLWHFAAGAEAGAGGTSAEGAFSAASKGYQVFRLADSGALVTVTVRMIRARPYLD